MKTLRYFLWLFLIFSPGFALAQPVQIDLGPAASYNAFIFSDFTSAYSDTQGRLAIGGHANLRHYTVGDRLDSSSKSPTLVVAGHLSFASGQVHFGDILLAGSAEDVAEPVRLELSPGAKLSEDAALPLDFEAAEAQLKATSRALAALESNTSHSGEEAILFLEGDGRSSLQVFHLHRQQIHLADSFQIEAIPKDAWVIFNIYGSQVTLANLDLSGLRGQRNQVIFNFPEATQLDIGSITIEGSVLAPLAQVNASQGTVSGQVIARSWQGNMQFHHEPFVPYTSETANQPISASTQLNHAAANAQFTRQE